MIEVGQLGIRGPRRPLPKAAVFSTVKIIAAPNVSLSSQPEFDQDFYGEASQLHRGWRAEMIWMWWTKGLRSNELYATIARIYLVYSPTLGSAMRVDQERFVAIELRHVQTVGAAS